MLITNTGLCHAYWAPNFWALYSFADRVLIQVYKLLKWPISENTSYLTRGLVGDSSFAILPQIPPITTLVLTVIFQLPILVKLFMKPTHKIFVYALILTAFASFNFGWHVHEKAILLGLIPLW